MGEEPGGELDFDELENMLEEEPPHNFGSSTSQNDEFKGKYDDDLIIPKDGNADELTPLNV
ncbi:hypothetical protein HanPSC8_Chr09g0400911 [Helianthus annuus]|nr:hypothetical protein HanPSC8_Chr09g0400911 [Helianthus annuus]